MELEFNAQGQSSLHYVRTLLALTAILECLLINEFLLMPTLHVTSPITVLQQNSDYVTIFILRPSLVLTGGKVLIVISAPVASGAH